MCTKAKTALWLSFFALLLAFSASASASASAGGKAAVRKQIENSMRVAGEIVIEPDGSVSAVEIKQESALPQGVVSFVRDAVLSWRFEPPQVDGKSVRTHSPMNLRLVAQKSDEGDYRIEVRSAYFTEREPAGPRTITSERMTPPKYPKAAYKMGVKGTAYLVLKVGRDGAVQEVFTEQVNLRVLATEPQMRRLRRILAQNAEASARDWLFRPPTEGEAANRGEWVVRVPVNYALGPDDGKSEYGSWRTYVPGPRVRAPWDTHDEANGFSPDALAEGGVYLAEQAGPRLLTPLQGS